MRKRVAFAAAASVGLAVAGGLAVVTQSASAATTGCSATYTVTNQWTGGFQGSVAFTNLGDPLTSWNVTFAFPDASQKVTQGWNATWTQSGANVTAASMSWNASVGTNASITLGFIGAYGSTNPVPTAIKVNGVTCNGSTTTPTASPTSARPTSASPTPSSTGGTGGGGYTIPAPSLHVSGNKLLTASGSTYRLLGVNRSSAEFACVQGKGMWDQTPDQASVNAMKTWNIHVVRIPINEQCWLGTNGSPSGATYQQNIKDYVNLLVNSGLNAIIDVHWTYGSVNLGGNGNCTDVNATCQKPMPDAQFAPQLWTSMGNAFKGNNAVLIDPFNEPWPDNADGYANTANEWKCLRDGGTCGGIPYQVAGMQTAVDSIRGTGATNVIMVGGLAWSNDLSQWLTYKPTDSTGNLMAEFHVYNFNSCVSTSCWDTNFGAVAKQVPVVAGEIGQNSCNHDFIDQVMNWADANGIGYLAWTWNVWGVCNSSGNDLITDTNGTPTQTFGQGFHDHLLTVHP